MLRSMSLNGLETPPSLETTRVLELYKSMDSLFSDAFPRVSTQAELNALFKEHPKYDPYYIASGSIPDRHERFENLYKIFKNHADSHFLSNIKYQFHERTWEMYVGCSLITRKNDFKSTNEGPDFLIEEGSKKIWIECTAPNRGEGDDKIPLMRDGVVQSVPEDKMCLRLTSALKTKSDKYRKYLKNGIVAEEDAFVIAINSGEFRFPADGMYPLILRALFGFGYPTITFPVGGGEAKHGWSKILSIKKTNKTEIPTTFFLKEENSNISGVLYCKNTVLNHANPVGEDILGVSNPIAKNPFPDILKTFGGYYFDPSASEWSLKPQ